MAETEAGKAKQIVVLMVGLPGSGKTTFCDNVMLSSGRPWSHVCEATVINDDAGTTAEWLNMARNSLAKGKSVFIDRYNIDKEQRSEFLKLGSPEVEVHAVVLELPAQVCISRTVTAPGFVGNLQRAGATLSVNKILEKKKLPEVEEGFSRILFCYNETDVENAVNLYNMLGPNDNLPSGCFGLQDLDAKINAPPASLESSSSNEANTTTQTNEMTTTVSGAIKGYMAETEAEKAKQIVVVMIGLPGSGKSTFCDNVMLSPCRPWFRVCQATVNNGKAGTTAQWVNMARNSLTEGKSVFIDSYNFNKEQRSEFIKLGSPEVEVHAVVLTIPNQVCINRLVTGTGHIANRQRQSATFTLSRILRQKQNPKVEEGFSRIMVCYNDTDVENAVNIYNMLGPKETLASGCFGVRDPPGSLASSSSNAANTTPQTKKRTRDWPTLAFPSISTEDYKFDPVRASDIIVKKVEEFLRYHGTARFILVASSHESKILSLVKTKASQKNIDSARFFTHVGDITKLLSKGGLKCHVIANPANWELKPGGEGVNGAIFMAAGPDLVAATRKRCGNIIVPGQAVSVALSPDSPLCSVEGITHVIHVLGPNMDPDQRNCLNNYIIGCDFLKEAYTSLFETFLSFLQVKRRSAKRLKQTTVSGSGQNNMVQRETRSL